MNKIYLPHQLINVIRLYYSENFEYSLNLKHKEYETKMPNMHYTYFLLENFRFLLEHNIYDFLYPNIVKSLESVNLPNISFLLLLKHSLGSNSCSIPLLFQSTHDYWTQWRTEVTKLKAIFDDILIYILHPNSRILFNPHHEPLDFRPPLTDLIHKDPEVSIHRSNQKVSLCTRVALGSDLGKIGVKYWIPFRNIIDNTYEKFAKTLHSSEKVKDKFAEILGKDVDTQHCDKIVKFDSIKIVYNHMINMNFEFNPVDNVITHLYEFETSHFNEFYGDNIVNFLLEYWHEFKDYVMQPEEYSLFNSRVSTIDSQESIESPYLLLFDYRNTTPKTNTLANSLIILKSTRMTVINSQIQVILDSGIDYHGYYEPLFKQTGMDAIIAKIRCNQILTIIELRFIELNFNTSDLKMMILQESRNRYLYKFMESMVQYNPSFVVDMCFCKSSYFIALNQYRMERWVGERKVLEGFIQVHMKRLVKSNFSVLLILEYLKHQTIEGNIELVRWLLTDGYTLDKLSKNNNMVELYKTIILLNYTNYIAFKPSDRTLFNYMAENYEYLYSNIIYKNLYQKILLLVDTPIIECLIAVVAEKVILTSKNIIGVEMIKAVLEKHKKSVHYARFLQEVINNAEKIMLNKYSIFLYYYMSENGYLCEFDRSLIYDFDQKSVKLIKNLFEYNLGVHFVNHMVKLGNVKIYDKVRYVQAQFQNNLELFNKMSQVFNGK